MGSTLMETLGKHQDRKHQAAVWTFNRRWQLGPGTGFIGSMTRNSGVPRDCIKFDPTDFGASLSLPGSRKLKCSVQAEIAHPLDVQSVADVRNLAVGAHGTRS